MNGLFGPLLVESLKQYASLTDLIAGHEPTLLALLLVDLFLLFSYLDALCRINDVYDGLGANGLHFLYEFSHVASVGEWTIYALC